MGKNGQKQGVLSGNGISAERLTLHPIMTNGGTGRLSKKNAALPEKAAKIVKVFGGVIG